MANIWSYVGRGFSGDIEEFASVGCSTASSPSASASDYSVGTTAIV
jgi:hypothetical protein